MDRLDLMRTLIAVADTGSFTAAGKRLGKSKALVSKHVGDLEDTLGVRLLNRTTRKVGVTEVGRAYLQRASELLTELDTLEEAVRANAASPRGRLKITAPQAFGELELMEMICAFQERFENIQPEVFLSDRVVDLVGEGYDVALRVTSLPDSALIVRRLCDVPVRICASPSYLAAHGTPQTPTELEEHPAIVDLNMPMRDAWRVCDGAGSVTIRVRERLSVNSAIAVRQAVLAGRGIGVCPDFVIARDIADGRLVEILDGLAEPQLAMHLLYPHRLHLSARARAFIDFAVEWYGKCPPWLRDGPG
ncbi:MAG: LysR family transcriptional regulator [Pseudomonadota bacterium]